MISPDKIAEWRKLCEGATPGPWTIDGGYVWGFCPLIKNQTTPTELIVEQDGHDYDKRFIAAARTALPELLDEVERLQKQIDEHDCHASIEEVEQSLLDQSKKFEWNND